VLVLDEPTSGMDVGAEAAIIDFLRDLIAVAA
jgi:ABC-type multidrug transport system ATPase subunit